MGQHKRTRAEKDELVRTQVLNLEEVRAQAQKDKRKRPLKVMFVLGLTLVLAGGAYQGYKMFGDDIINKIKEQGNVVQRVDTSKKDKEEKEDKPKEKEEVKPQVTTTTMKCSIVKLGNENGTNYTSDFTFTFEDGGLVSELKEFALDGIEGTPFGMGSMTNLYTAYRQFEITIPGYSVTTAPREDRGFSVTTTINLKELDTSRMVDSYQNNEQVRNDFEKGTTADVVKATFEPKGYTCQ